ncbi:MAG: ABC transporter permease [Chroococcidiopsidaceae cyanobacterium CP_BM_ER_R8_30]|nr:ABC transporter permease [Chroococcidiopsidaceae cyanobacterium CP_BM_ER_R8_30]
MINFLDTILGSRFWALFQKEFAQILRNRQLLVQLLVPPTVFLILFGMALDPNIKNLKVGITDYSNSRISRDFIEIFYQTDAFVVSRYYAKQQEMTADLAKGKLNVGITIPPEFSRDIARRRTAQVQALFDAVDANTATTASSYISRLVEDYNQRQSEKNSFSQLYSSSSSTTGNFSSTSNLSNQTSDSTTDDPSAQTGSSTSNSSTQQNNSNFSTSGSSINLSQLSQRNQVELATSVFYNPGLDSAWFIVPGTIGILLTTIGSQAAGSLLVREKEAGTIEQLVMTPASTTEILLAKISPLLILLTFDMLVALAVGRLVFGMPFRGNLFALLVIAILYFWVGISIGILIASYAKSEQQSQLMAFFVNPPLVLLSGATYPISSMSTFVQWLTYLNPLRYFVEVCRGIILKGVGLEVLWSQVLILMGFATVLMSLSIRQFRRQLT